MQFRIIHMDSHEKLNEEKFNKLSDLIRDFEYSEEKGWKYNYELELFFMNPLRIGMWFPDEVCDTDMKSLPVPELTNYAHSFEFEDDVELPDDLSPSETVLTDLLWGKRNKGIAVLLVAALENMDMADVRRGIREMGLY